MFRRILAISILVSASAWAQEAVTATKLAETGMKLMRSGDFVAAANTFQNAIDLDSANTAAIKGLVAAKFNLAGRQTDSIDKNRLLDEAVNWNQRLIELNPKETEAYYSLGVIDWTKAYGDLRIARANLGMKPEDPGPLIDFRVRQEMRARYGTTIDAGIANLRKALEIDPNYSDAMAYLNLLLRSRADIRDTAEEASEDTREANGWVSQAMEAKEAQGGFSSHTTMLAPPPPSPPPPSPPPPPGSIRVGQNVAAMNLIANVEPVYPPLARQARIQGTVKFNVVIGKDGRMEQMTLVSGHPLLVAAAQEAVRQWVYKPTLLNGQPVPVITTVEVTFALGA